MKSMRLFFAFLLLVLACTGIAPSFASTSVQHCGKAALGSLYVEHHVTPADHGGISSIVGRYRVQGHVVPDWQSVAATNNLAAPYTIYAGETILCIPVQSAVPVQAIWPAEHTVTKGQTLSQIAQLYWIADWHMFARKNSLENPDRIFPKQTLVLPEPAYIARDHTGKTETNIAAQEIAPVKMSVKPPTHLAIPDKNVLTIIEEFLAIRSNQILLAIVAMLLGGLLYLVDERASYRRELLRLRTELGNEDITSPHEEDPWSTQAVTIAEDTPLGSVAETDIDDAAAKHIQTTIQERDRAPRWLRRRSRTI